MRIQLHDHQNAASGSRLDKLNRQALAILRFLNIRGVGTIDISLVDDDQMEQLNQELLRHKGTTDVISIRYDGVLKTKRISRVSHAGPEGEESIVGEIWISPAEAERYAEAHGLSAESELIRYIAHGLLHWIGFDDQTETDRRRMRRRENQAMAAAGIGE